MLAFRWISDTQLTHSQHAISEVLRQWAMAWSPHKNDNIQCDRLQSPDLSGELFVYESTTVQGHCVVIGADQDLLDVIFRKENFAGSDADLLRLIAERSRNRLVELLHGAFTKHTKELQLQDIERCHRANFENENLFTWFSLSLADRRLQIGISNTLLSSVLSEASSVKGLYRRDELLSSESVKLDVTLCLGAVPLQSLHGLRVGDIVTSGASLQSTFAVRVNQKALFQASLVAVDENKAIHILGKGE